MRCLGCDYSLDGLAADRCPECWRPFDSNDSRTFKPDAGDAIVADPRGRFCRGCGMNLERATGTCPNCFQPFDASDPSTWLLTADEPTNIDADALRRVAIPFLLFVPVVAIVLGVFLAIAAALGII
jgi:predicted amidophosphoribosyltransferase